MDEDCITFKWIQYSRNQQYKTLDFPTSNLIHIYLSSRTLPLVTPRSLLVLQSTESAVIFTIHNKNRHPKLLDYILVSASYIYIYLSNMIHTQWTTANTIIIFTISSNQDVWYLKGHPYMSRTSIWASMGVHHLIHMLYWVLVHNIQVVIHFATFDIINNYVYT